jgi:hypothetical protein
VARSSLGDETAWRWLHETHQQHVFTIVRRVVGNDDDAADLSQAAWIRIVRKLHLFEHGSLFKTWHKYSSVRPRATMVIGSAMASWYPPATGKA